MVLKIERPPNMTAEGEGGRLVDEREAKKQKRQASEQRQQQRASPVAPPDPIVAGEPSRPPQHPQRRQREQHHPSEARRPHHPPDRPPACSRCAGCGAAETVASPLLLFEDPEDDPRGEGKEKAGEEERYCAGCMTGKKVRVFWPVDSQWYIADVQRYDADTGEHLLRYPDGDTEWVRIGEDHTTNAQYKEYFSSLKNGDPGEGNISRPPSLGNGASFALSTVLSQSFGLPPATEEEAAAGRLRPPSQGQRLFQQLNLDRTASSMSSFGMFPHGSGGRQPPYGGQQQQQQGPEGANQRAPPFQILSPNFTHSFSSKIGRVPSLEYGPHHDASKAGPPPQMPYGPPHPHPHPQSREEGSNLSSTSPGTRDGAPPPPRAGPWPPSNQYSDPGYYSGAPPPMYSYPAAPPSYEGKPHLPQPPARPPSSSPKPGKGGSARDRSRKALAKAWTKPEDEHLLDLVLEMKHPLKWSIIAQSLCDYSATVLNGETPERTGKQCRERYVNHLNPRLKHTEFSPLEDATIWRLYATIGTQWAKMSKVIPGRTDNNLKNRFHNLKRQLQREEESRLRAQTPEDYDDAVYVERVREAPRAMRTRIEDMWNQPRHIGLVAADSVADSREDEAGTTKDDGKDKEESDGQRRFGPFEPASAPTQCGRCGLFLPSVQCGTELCARTGWCRTCAKVSMHLCGNVLRECLNLRKGAGGGCGDDGRELAEGVEKSMKEIWKES